MDRLGLQLMVVTQEEENEQILGKLTTLRKLYYRELIARFSHHHALLWDLSEEMDRWRYYSTEDIQELCRYIKGLGPYDHPIQYVQWKGELLPDEKGYGRLLGFPLFDGTALQHDPEFTHEATKKYGPPASRPGRSSRKARSWHWTRTPSCGSRPDRRPEGVRTQLGFAEASAAHYARDRSGPSIGPGSQRGRGNPNTTPPASVCRSVI